MCLWLRNTTQAGDNFNALNYFSNTISMNPLELCRVSYCFLVAELEIQYISLFDISQWEKSLPPPPPHKKDFMAHKSLRRMRSMFEDGWY